MSAFLDDYKYVIAALIGFAGVMYTRWHTARADRDAEDLRRANELAASNKARGEVLADKKVARDLDLADRREARAASLAEEHRLRGLEGVQRALDAALKLKDELSDDLKASERWTPNAKKYLREIQAAALLVDRKDVRHGLYNGVDAVNTVMWRATFEEPDLKVPEVERHLVGHVRDLAAAYLRGHEESLQNHATQLAEAKKLGQYAVDELFGQD